jgi:RNA polymerase sigma-70 factor (ECF subfamily)
VHAGYEDDTTLVAALQAGDEDAFAWLLDRYDGPLRRMARSFVATQADADEVVGETWLGVIKGIGRFQARSSLKTWIFQILMNQARTRGAREKRTVPFASIGGHPGDGSSEDGPIPGFGPERFRTAAEPYPGHWSKHPDRWRPEEDFDQQELGAIIRRAIDDLPPAQRTVLTLRDVEGWSSEEVCNVLDISPTNQRVILHRARAKVRAALDPLLSEEVDA